jgi:hypothetical protein
MTWLSQRVMRKPLLFAASHLACLAAGAFLAVESGSTASRESRMAATKVGQRSDTGIPEARQEALAAIAASKAAPFDATRATAEADRWSGTGDGERRTRTLMAEGRTGDELAGAFLAWFREDPEAALRFYDGRSLTREEQAMLRLALAGLAAEEQLKLMVAFNGSMRRHDICTALGLKLAAMSPADGAKVLGSLGAAELSPLRGYLAIGWPADAAAAFLDLAVAFGDVQLVHYYLTNSGSPRKSSALLREMEARGDLPAEFREFLDQASELRGHLYRYADPSVALDERIEQMRHLEWLKDATPEKLREGALKQISTVDINELMKTGPDYRYAFRHGAMTAEQVLEAVKADLPELAAASDFETRVRVFNELAGEDPEAAFALISHLPEEERDLAVIHQARWSFRDLAPDTFLAMISLAKGPDSPEAATQRADAWQNFTRRVHYTYGADYQQWVRDLPPGGDRTAARAGLAAYLRDSGSTTLAEEFAKP